MKRVRIIYLSQILAAILMATFLQKTPPIAAQDASFVEIKNEPHHQLKFENEYVRVWETMIPAGGRTLWHIHHHDNVVITLAGANVRVENSGGAAVENKMQLGEVGFRKATYVHRAISIGSRPFHNITIEILRSPYATQEELSTPGMGPLIYPSPRPAPRISVNLASIEIKMGRKPVLDNDWVRVYRISLKPGQSTATHTQLLSGLGVAITAGRIEVITEGKSKPDRRRVAVGGVQWHNIALPHAIKNVGRSKYEAVDIELK